MYLVVYADGRERPLMIKRAALKNAGPGFPLQVALQAQRQGLLPSGDIVEVKTQQVL
jgi:hypothetical protein